MVCVERLKRIVLKLKITFIDKINKHRVCFSIIISAILSGLYVSLKFSRSIRSCVSDFISISSIILGILGVFIGLLISLRNSDFVKTLNKYLKRDKNGNDAFQYLLNYIKKQFVISIIFVFITVAIDVIPSIIFKPMLITVIAKFILITIWITLFLLTLWGTFYVVHIIVKIELKDYENSQKTKDHGIE